MKTLLIVLALSFSLPSQAVDLDANIGISKYIDGDNGLWYLNPFQHNMKMQAPAGQVGLSGIIAKYDNIGISLRGSWSYLGSVHTDALVPSVRTNTAQGQWIGPDFKGASMSAPCHGSCTYLSDFKGSGHDQGFAFAIEPFYKVGKYTLSASAGIYEHKSTWSENVTGVYSSAQSVFPYSIEIDSNSGWKRGSVRGVAISSDHIELRYQFFLNPGSVSDSAIPAWNRTHLITIGYKF